MLGLATPAKVGIESIGDPVAPGHGIKDEFTIAMIHGESDKVIIVRPDGTIVGSMSK